MAEDNFHYQIPDRNIRKEKYDKFGFSPSVQRVSYAEHGSTLKQQATTFKEKEFTKKDIAYSSQLFIQIETPEKVSVKSQKQKIENLGFELFSFSANNESIANAIITKEKFNEFEQRLENYINTEDHVGKTYFAPIERISSIPPENKIDDQINYESEDSMEIIINLYSTINPKELLAISNTLEIDLRNYTNEILKRTFKNGITSLFCSIAPLHLTKIAAEFSTIKEINLSQTFTVPQAIEVDPMPTDIKINSIQSSSTICIVDSGIYPNEILKNFIKEQVGYPNPAAIDFEYNHGTFVASRCIFGDEIDHCLATKELHPYCNVLDLSVFGINSLNQTVGPSDFTLRCAIEDIVLKYYETIKVYNLSLGVPVSIQNYKFSDLAKLLDYLAKEYKVLFVVAAGNINRLLGDYPALHFSNPNSRIGSPAESLLSLTVGSVVKHSTTHSLSENGFISPFSRKGPGADNGIKPEVVAHGGNLISPYAQIPRISTYGISKSGQNLSADVGTSFAAPLISQYAQRLFDFYPSSDANLVKALLCHFTENRNKPDELLDDNIYYVGFGEPNIELALRSAKNNSAYIYEGYLDQENYQFITFHIPQKFADTTVDSKLRIKVTITYDPTVNPDNEKEYSESRISATLIKNSVNGMKEISLSDEKYNLPWNPIIQFEKSFTRGFLAGAWELRLRLYTRGKTSENYLQNYATVIEIIDDNKTIDVYNDIENEFSEIYNKIEVSVGAA
ncbi:hypothetical protein FCR2A7T_02310 [Flavobacterium cauense R2A-7]|uniref:Subtilase family protein n=1 Tax=Flavobacterium cauense R2A-7 TaxID=1341154 RepID=V6S518_9FLAO|nr:S8 family peptidase [Flavobacterium cauense]ESU21773.1 hypothetical protein FCR2A7T_02310 [Flavobacterium cauense R2A-7]KGO81005.1 hypothetical protein Q762_10220 [Flavobacterium cauense R2A-7]TWI12920.1 subtilase family protein [Flavobacterium cauense R2A-7]